MSDTLLHTLSTAGRASLTCVPTKKHAAMVLGVLHVQASGYAARGLFHVAVREGPNRRSSSPAELLFSERRMIRMTSFFGATALTHRFAAAFQSANTIASCRLGIDSSTSGCMILKRLTPRRTLMSRFRLTGFRLRDGGSASIT